MSGVSTPPRGGSAKGAGRGAKIPPKVAPKPRRPIMQTMTTVTTATAGDINANVVGKDGRPSAAAAAATALAGVAAPQGGGETVGVPPGRGESDKGSGARRRKALSPPPLSLGSKRVEARSPPPTGGGRSSDWRQKATSPPPAGAGSRRAQPRSSAVSPPPAGSRRSGDPRRQATSPPPSGPSRRGESRLKATSPPPTTGSRQGEQRRSKAMSPPPSTGSRQGEQRRPKAMSPPPTGLRSGRPDSRHKATSPPPIGGRKPVARSKATSPPPVGDKPRASVRPARRPKIITANGHDPNLPKAPIGSQLNDPDRTADPASGEVTNDGTTSTESPAVRTTTAVTSDPDATPHNGSPAPTTDPDGVQTDVSNSVTIPNATQDAEITQDSTPSSDSDPELTEVSTNGIIPPVVFSGKDPDTVSPHPNEEGASHIPDDASEGDLIENNPRDSDEDEEDPLAILELGEAASNASDDDIRVSDPEMLDLDQDGDDDTLGRGRNHFDFIERNNQRNNADSQSTQSLADLGSAPGKWDSSVGPPQVVISSAANQDRLLLRSKPRPGLCKSQPILSHVPATSPTSAQLKSLAAIENGPPDCLVGSCQTPPEADDVIVLPDRYLRQIRKKSELGLPRFMTDLGVPDNAKPELLQEHASSSSVDEGVGSGSDPDFKEVSDAVEDREKDIDVAIKWLRQEILQMKQQDRSLMRSLLELRARLHQIRGLSNSASISSTLLHVGTSYNDLDCYNWDSFMSLDEGALKAQPHQVGCMVPSDVINGVLMPILDRSVSTRVPRQVERPRIIRRKQSLGSSDEDLLEEDYFRN